MISKKQWGVLLLVYLFYLLAGAFIFLALEAKHELNKLEDKLVLQKRLSSKFNLDSANFNADSYFLLIFLFLLHF